MIHHARRLLRLRPRARRVLLLTNSGRPEEIGLLQATVSYGNYSP